MIVLVTRLFVAAWPDAPTRRALAALPVDDALRRVPPRYWHVTLRFLGESDPRAVADALRGASLPMVTATLGATVDHMGRQLVVPVAGVEPLEAAIRTATGTIGEPPRRRFVGHLTLARVPRGADPTGSPVLGAAVSGSFDITEVALVESELRPTGAVYRILATFPTGR